MRNVTLRHITIRYVTSRHAQIALRAWICKNDLNLSFFSEASSNNMQLSVHNKRMPYPSATRIFPLGQFLSVELEFLGLDLVRCPSQQNQNQTQVTIQQKSENCLHNAKFAPKAVLTSGKNEIISKDIRSWVIYCRSEFLVRLCRSANRAPDGDPSLHV